MNKRQVTNIAYAHSCARFTSTIDITVMIEVFKTNVTERDQANRLVDQIHKTFMDYKANFDLEDCDRILRVKAVSGRVQPSQLIGLLKDFGFHAEVLPDDPPVMTNAC
jgi:hypothetical protein